jgi:hypothetical protein
VVFNLQRLPFGQIRTVSSAGTSELCRRLAPPEADARKKHGYPSQADRKFRILATLEGFYTYSQEFKIHEGRLDGEVPKGDT